MSDTVHADLLVLGFGKGGKTVASARRRCSPAPRRSTEAFNEVLGTIVRSDEPELANV